MARLHRGSNLIWPSVGNNITRQSSLQPRLFALKTLRQSRHISFVPTILQPRFWKSLIPSTPGRPASEQQQGPRKRKPWNPATFYIWMFLLIGSQSIQMLTLRGHFSKYTQHTEAKLALLRDVVRRIQNGEDVDVEAALGTGDKEEERAWDDVMRELENEDKLYNEGRKSRLETPPTPPNK